MNMVRIAVRVTTAEPDMVQLLIGNTIVFKELPDWISRRREGEQPDHAGEVVALLTGRLRATEDQVVDVAGGKLRYAGKELTHDSSSEVIGSGEGERTLVGAAHGAPYGGGDHDVGHGTFSH